MRRRVYTFILPLVLAACSLGLEARAQAQYLAPEVRTPTAATLDSVLKYGADLEARRQWADVLTHYEEALRNFPNDAQLQDRLDQARIHYGIVRRYGDNSYRKSLTTLNEQDALDHYGEVLVKVQSHYVHDPDWQHIVDRGTRAIEIALADEVFARENLKDVPAEWVDAYRRELRRQIGLMVIRDRQTTVDAVRVAGQLARRHLGLAPSVVILEYLYQTIITLDEYSTYLTANQLNDLYAQIDGNFVGLGIELQADRGALLIVKVIPGSPAMRGGLRPGDRIVAVDGKATDGLSTDQAASMLQGAEDSIVEVTIQSGDEPARRLQLRRQQIEVPSVDTVKILDQNSGLGYLRLTSFQKTTAKEIDDALWTLHRAGMRSLVMDLRGNPGGLLTTAVEVADRFIDSGRIVSTRGRSPDQNWTYSAHKAGTWRMPLIVLIDHDSASAAEIFAGAIRDHRRGYLIGETSYGKGSVQSIFSLSRASAGLRLTTAKFYSPNGLPFAKIGVTPHVVVTRTAKPVDGSTALLAGEADPVIAEALRVAETQFTQVSQNQQ